MSTDRELLELAAKAAGYPIDIIGDEAVIFGIDAGPDGPREWNPLIDDGDALRLAVKLGLAMDSTLSRVWVSLAGSAAAISVEEPITTDGAMSTRRAIVRAAAEIGRSMP